MSHKQSVQVSKNGSPNGHSPAAQSNPEVVPKAKRRTFSAEQKLRILAEADACTSPGEVGALLRREGIYSSHLDQWRKQRQRGVLQALAPQRRGPKVDPQAEEIAKLRRENERLQARLAQAETIIEVQKKLSMLLGLPTATNDGQS
jgi:transposase-like protein